MCSEASQNRPHVAVRHSAGSKANGFGQVSDEADAIIVGSGINGLVAAAELAGRRRYRPHGSLRPPNERSVRISRTTLYREVAGQAGP